jgi:hypothetical protein
MPAIVDAAELRQILGVSSALYSDGYLDSILDASEQTILPLLTQYRSSVAAVEVRTEIIYFNTIRYNFFVPGQSVIVAGCVPDSYNGTYTVTDDRIEAFTFSAAKAGAADTTIAVPQIPGAPQPFQVHRRLTYTQTLRQYRKPFSLWQLRFSNPSPLQATRS